MLDRRGAAADAAGGGRAGRRRHGVARAAGHIAWGPALAALAGSLAIQIGTNFANDVFDAEKGADGPDRIGPVRAVAAGLISAARDEARDDRGVRDRDRVRRVSRERRRLADRRDRRSRRSRRASRTPAGRGRSAITGSAIVFVFVFFGFVAVCGTAYVQLAARAAPRACGPPCRSARSRPRSSSSTTCAIARPTCASASARSRCGSGARGALVEYALLLVASYAVADRPRGRALAIAWLLLPLASLPLAVARMRALVACGHRSGVQRVSRRDRAAAARVRRAVRDRAVPVMRIVGVAHRTRALADRAARRRARALDASATAVIVGVRSDDGATGLGEAAPLPGMSIDSIADAAAAFADLAACVPIAIDSPAHATGIADRITAAPAARFAIETALLAALAQHARHEHRRAVVARSRRASSRSAVVVDDPRRGARCGRARRALREDQGRAIPSSCCGSRRRCRACACASMRIARGRATDVDRMARRARAPADRLRRGAVRRRARAARAPPALPDRARREPRRARARGARARADVAGARRADPEADAARRLRALSSSSPRSRIATASRRSSSHALEGPIGTAACIELARAIGADVPVGLAPHPGARALLRRS